MPKLTKPGQHPRLSRHVRGQAFVKIDGRVIWLGRYGEPATAEAYDRLIGEWLANGRTLPPDPTPEPVRLTVTVIVRDYWRDCQARKLSDARLAKIKSAVRHLKAAYGSTPAAEFGPVKLKAVRARMIDAGLRRSTVNEWCAIIKAVFRHAVADQKVPATILHGLNAVEGLRSGQSDAKESEAVKPVSRADIRKVRRHVARPVRALIALQQLTAARPGELLSLRGTDIDTKGDVWTYKPALHKTAHKGKDRTIYFGPRAQRVLGQFLTPGRATDKPLFSPREAVAEHKARGAGGRRRADQKPHPNQSDRVVREHYDKDSYRKAIQSACVKAGVAKWHPHRLRHNSATFIRREFGVEAASLIPGHSGIDVTLLYAEANEQKARKIIGKVG